MAGVNNERETGKAAERRTHALYAGARISNAEPKTPLPTYGGGGEPLTVRGTVDHGKRSRVGDCPVTCLQRGTSRASGRAAPGLIRKPLFSR